LQLRFANLEEESRLQSMTEMLAFARKPGENVNALLARYEVVRQRAANEGRFVMSIEGCALQLLRATGVQPAQLTTLFQQFGGRLPMNEVEYQALITQVRRQGHIYEAAPGNIATILQGPFHQARPGSYYQQGQDQNANQQLNSYWAGQGHGANPAQQPLAQMPVAPWAAPSSGSQSADAGGWWNTPVSGSQSADANWNQPWNVFATNSQPYYDPYVDEDDDSSATSSDDGTEALPDPAIAGMSPPDAAQVIYAQLQKAKRVWRRFTGRPVRKSARSSIAFPRGRVTGKVAKGIEAANPSCTPVMK
jgi:hypothetical protein